MKTKLFYLIVVLFALHLGVSGAQAQSGSEIKFKLLDDPSITNKNLVTVSVVINTRQPVSGNGIRFILIVKNNSGNTITTKNIVNMLRINLYNEQGLNISVPNDALNDVKINRHPEDRKWRFRSESVIADKVYVNGVEDKRSLKMQENIEIPTGGEWKVNLILRNVKQIETSRDVPNRILKPTIDLRPGKYKLRLYVFVFSAKPNNSGGYNAIYQSPMIDINYGD